jgi:hypothetical protein
MKFFSFLLSLVTICALAQPVPDMEYRVKIDNPIFEKGAGPKVLIDEAHNNLHRKEGGLFAFARMMEDDGAQVFSNQEKITDSLLEKYDVLVIVNALHDSNVGNWQNPCPSAFTKEEIVTIGRWIENGGSLLLVADHMPYGGAVQDLAKLFGVKWSNSFAIRNGQNWPPSIFSKESKTLLHSPVSNNLQQIASFSGSVFRAPKNAIPFMVFDSSHEILMPEIAWQFSKKTKHESAEGWLQGACLEYGQGKVLLLGEAAMITAQLAGDRKAGMNNPEAPENGQLALNIFRWLTID